jgi:phosphohistidine phosphatase
LPSGFHLTTVDIYILRHGRAEKRAPSVHGDAGRALTGEGRTEILGVAEFLASRDVVFGCIATSPYVRALETAQIVTKALGKRGLLVQWEELTPGSSIEALESRISSRSEDESLLIVGHEPLLGAFTGYMISGGHEAAIALGKGGLAKIRNARFDPVSGELQWLLTVRQIMSMK